MEASCLGDRGGTAAEKAGVCRRTVGQWLHGDPEFQAVLRNRRS